MPNQETFNEGRELLIEMHSLLHNRGVYESNIETIYDSLWKELKEETCRVISKKTTSILWNIWHITRIEDIISNIVIKNKEEVFDKDIQTRLNIEIRDTGNAMGYSDIELFNKNIDIESLKEYRIEVGKSTRNMIETLSYSDIKIKVKREQLEKIRETGDILENEKSIWLLDFWGKKNLLGLIMMPITRHQINHLNDCFKIKEKYN
jgi:hypothetical protein